LRKQAGSAGYGLFGNKKEKMQFYRVLSLLTALMLAFVAAEPPHEGGYRVLFSDYPVDTLDQPFAEVVVAYPISAPNDSFPLISFAHGAFTGGPQTQVLHRGIMSSMASHGFIVAAVKSCMVGCSEGRWDNYWEEQLKVIDWAQSPEMRNDPIIGKVNHEVGYGLAGHSMGGQATARSSTRANSYNAKAAILLHPYSDRLEDIGADIQVPIIGLTGTLDGCCGEDSTRNYLDNAVVTKTLANMVGALHTEPNRLNSRWGAYMAAWFQIYINNDRGTYYSLIYDNNNPDSLCNFYAMQTCEHSFASN